MTQENQELMDRYIYQVVRRLPKEQKNEAGMELRELIGDMFEQSGAMDAVLSKLGDPAEYAKKYRDDACCLIGPEYFDTYLWVLKIVMVCTLISIIPVSLVVGIWEKIADAGTDYIETAAETFSHIFTNIISNSIISCISAFGAITLIFSIMERQKIKIDKHNKKWSAEETTGLWTPKLLTPIPDKKAVINRGDTIVGIVFIVFFCTILIVCPQLCSLVLKGDEGMIFIPCFNLEQWDRILPVLIASLLFGLADEILRLIEGVYCRLVMISTIICDVLQIILSIIILKVFPFWNPDFTTFLKVIPFWNPDSTTQILIQPGEQAQSGFWAIWNGDFLSNIILSGIIVISLVEICIAVYKTHKYGLG